jgi:hypothetical protein
MRRAGHKAPVCKRPERGIGTRTAFLYEKSISIVIIE